MDRTLWSDLEAAVGGGRTAEVNIWETLGERLDFSKRKPAGIVDVEVAIQQTSQGERYCVLKNLETGVLLKLGERDYFLWGLMDGDHSVRDLAVAYFVSYGSFPFDRLVRLIAQLKANGFLRERPTELYRAVASQIGRRGLAFRLAALSERFTQREFSLKNADRFFDILSCMLGRTLFSVPAALLFLAIVIAGTAAFVSEIQSGRYQLLGSTGAHGLGLLLLLLCNSAMLLAHECGHGLACKRYGRKVPRAGILLYMGMLAWFVDTTDIWMKPRSARLAVSLAGPAATLVVASLLASLVALFPSCGANELLFMAAFMGYLSAVLNLNPLLEWDGYYLLVDWLEIPMLRKKSLDFVRGRLLTKLFKERNGFSREERVFALFGVMAACWTGLAILVVLYLWQLQFQRIAGDLVAGRDPLSTAVVGGIVIIAGMPMVLGLAARLLLLASGSDAGRLDRTPRTTS